MAPPRSPPAAALGTAPAWQPVRTWRSWSSRGGGQVVPAVDRVALFTPHLGPRHQIGQSPVPVGGSGEQNQMVGLGEVRRLGAMRAHTAPSTQPPLTSLGPGVTMLIPFLSGRHRVTRAGWIGLEPDLHPVDGGQTGFLCRLPESRHSIEPVVIGDRQCHVAEIDGPIHQVFGMRGSIEEGEIGMTVQLGVPAHPLTISNVCSTGAPRSRTECVLGWTYRRSHGHRDQFLPHRHSPRTAR